MVRTIARVSEHTLDRYRPKYLDGFVAYHAELFEWTHEYTQRVTRDAVRFLWLSAQPIANQPPAETAQVMVCSPDVDKIVDAIFLDSPLLMWLEANVFGARMLHVPYYAHGVTDATINNAQYDFTIAMMRAAGYPIDERIWPPRLPAGYLTCGCSNDLEDCKVMPYREQ